MPIFQPTPKPQIHSVSTSKLCSLSSGKSSASENSTNTEAASKQQDTCSAGSSIFSSRIKSKLIEEQTHKLLQQVEFECWERKLER